MAEATDIAALKKYFAPGTDRKCNARGSKYTRPELLEMIKQLIQAGKLDKMTGLGKKKKQLLCQILIEYYHPEVVSSSSDEDESSSAEDVSVGETDVEVGGTSYARISKRGRDAMKALANLHAEHNTAESRPHLDKSYEKYSWHRDKIYKSFVLPNSTSFPSAIEKHFSELVLTEDHEVAAGQLFPHQRFVPAYLGSTTPYRGLLAFHGLGAGKTRQAIATAIDLRDQKGPDMHILLLVPASLQDNFRNEIREWDPLFKVPAAFASQTPEIKQQILLRSNQDIDMNYHFINYNGKPIPELRKMGIYVDSDGTIHPPRNFLIIIEEAHNLIHRMLPSDTGVKSATGQTLYDLLINAENCKFLALSGTPMIDFPHELAVLFNILRGKMNYKGEQYTLFPGLNHANVFHQEYVNANLTINHRQQVKFKKRIIGMVSYYKGGYEKTVGALYPEIDDDAPLIIELKMEEDQFLQYQAAREIEQKREKSRRRSGKVTSRNTKQTNSGKKGVGELQSTFRQLSRMVGNFAFPDSIARPNTTGSTVFEEWPEELDLSLAAIEPPQLKVALSWITTGEKDTDDATLDALIAEFQSQASKDGRNQMILGLIDRNARYVKETVVQNALRDFVSPDKIHQALIERAETVDNPADAFHKAMSLFDYHPEILQGKSLQQISPKMADMLAKIVELDEDVEDDENEEPSTGWRQPTFVYSNYKTLEGVGLFAKVLEANGYSRFDSTTDTETNGLRYGMYIGGTDKEKLEREVMRKFFNDTDKNFRGQRLQVVLGTGAAAEGLTFKGVRQVLIMEPHWNRVRIGQVIGRGRRLKSHTHLPLIERTIQAFMYSICLTKSQSKSLGEDKSTDQHIDQIALRKEYLSNQFMQLMKEAAVDCKLNAAHNETIECLHFDKHRLDQYAYMPNAKDDLHETSQKWYPFKLRDAPAKLQAKLLDTKGNNKYWIKSNNPNMTVSVTLKKTKYDVIKLYQHVAEKGSSSYVLSYYWAKRPGTKSFKLIKA